MEAVAVSVAAAPIALTAATLDEKAEEGATLVAAAALDVETGETAALAAATALVTMEAVVVAVSVCSSSSNSTDSSNPG